MRLKFSLFTFLGENQAYAAKIFRLPMPGNLSMWWNFGSLLGLCLVVQLVTGFMLSWYYVLSDFNSFDSVMYIMREVKGGWFMRFFHMNGSSAFFVLLYLHMSRGIYYGSYRKPKVWLSGVSLYVMIMLIAFLGYVLPWGQMSFWGATVITSLISVFPGGDLLIYCLWGDFSISDVTVSRFFVLHFFLPFLVVGMVLLHILFLHEEGSSNPLGAGSYEYSLSFKPYFVWKDLMGVFLFLGGFWVFIFFFPYYLSDPVNAIEADSLSTPVHIKPEWYFLWAYALLRSVPNKTGGVFLMILGIMMFYLMPKLDNSFCLGFYFCPLNGVFFLTWFFCIFVFLSWLGGCPAEGYFLSVSQVISFLFFFNFMYFKVKTFKGVTF